MNRAVFFNVTVSEQTSEKPALTVVAASIPACATVVMKNDSIANGKVANLFPSSSPYLATLIRNREYAMISRGRKEEPAVRANLKDGFRSSLKESIGGMGSAIHKGDEWRAHKVTHLPRPAVRVDPCIGSHARIRADRASDYAVLAYKAALFEVSRAALGKGV